VVDGFTAEEIRLMLETDIDGCERLAESDAKVFEAAGGYAPTIGILGAVLGLIQVMKHLDQMQEIGRGIAVAFVATIYGVAAANILLLPLGAKIRNQARGTSKTNEMILEGILAVQEGRNPRLLRELLEPFAFGSPAREASDKGAASAVPFPENRRAS
jgi:chemotaxis protein MotA